MGTGVKSNTPDMGAQEKLDFEFRKLSSVGGPSGSWAAPSGAGDGFWFYVLTLT